MRKQKMITVISARRFKGKKFGARKYALVPSQSHPGVSHKVVKVRVRNSRNYKYLCTCEDFVFNQHSCKHIKNFKRSE